MNKLFLLAAVFAVAATRANAFPKTMLSQLYRPVDTRQAPRCSGDPSTDLGRCMAPLEFLEHPSSGLHLDSVDQAAQLDLVCNELKQASRCVGEVHAQCGQGDLMSELMTRTVMNVVGYLCRADNKEVILNNADCWENKALENDIERCGQEVQVGPYDDPCSALNGVKDCMTQKVAAVCSAEAASFIDGLLYEALSPIANDLLSCDIRLRVSRSVWKMLPRTRK